MHTEIACPASVCVVVCCSVLQSLKLHALQVRSSNTLQHTTTHCNTLPHTATDYHTLQHTTTHCNSLPHTHSFRACNVQCLEVRNSTAKLLPLVCVSKSSVKCSSCQPYHLINLCVLQCVAVCCSVLQCVLQFVREQQQRQTTLVPAPSSDESVCVAVCCRVCCSVYVSKSSVKLSSCQPCHLLLQCIAVSCSVL